MQLQLARRYRPSSPDMVVGQEDVLITIANAVKSDSFPSSILLTGIHGVGKTSIGRIIAKMLNCTNKSEKEIVCSKCFNCKAIDTMSHVDVIELDAASNTSVEDVKVIIENARYSPCKAEYKVYIIDEAHMLSKSAFNALLKALEEPSEHVKFILATTEMSKIPPTILSRCMKFTLKRLSISEISETIHYIANKESVNIDKESVKIISELSLGSMRDALSMLDLAIAYCNGPIELEMVKNIFLGNNSAISYEVLYNVVNGDAKNALSNIKVAYNSNISAQDLLEKLLKATHAVSILLTQKESYRSLTSIEKELSEKFVSEHKDLLSITKLSRIWQIALKGTQDIKISPDAYIALEMIVIRLCSISLELPSIQKTINNLKKITPLKTQPPPPSSTNKTISWEEILKKLKESCTHEDLLSVISDCELTDINEHSIMLRSDFAVSEKTKSELVAFLKSTFGIDFSVNIVVKKASDTVDSDLLKEISDVFPGSEVVKVS